MEPCGYGEAVEYLERIPSYAREKSPLPDVRAFLEQFGSPDREFQIFHVAGTNGKGSVCAFLTAVLRETGRRVGTFTSPHLVELRERFAVDGETVSEREFAEAFLLVRRAADAWTLRGKPHPTYFEFLFYMGLLLFRRAKVKIAVLETGMGGLLDVTNVIEHPLVSVITSISIDHTKYLGNTIAEIAAHKAGIIKAGAPVVFDASCREAGEVIRERAAALGCDRYAVIDECCTVEEFGPDFMAASLDYGGERVSLRIPFAAPYQAANASLAAKALEVSGLAVEKRALRAGIAATTWPARMECVRPWLYLDGAHNEGGVLAFLDAAGRLKEQMKPDSVCVLFAVAADKDYKRMLALIGERLRPDRWLLAQAESARALPVDELLAAAKAAIPRGAKIECFADTSRALDALLRGRTDGELAFIVGSLYLAGEMKKEITDD